MDRITTRVNKKKVQTNAILVGDNEYIGNEELAEAIERLATYDDMCQEGRMVDLGFAIGDKVHFYKETYGVLYGEIVGIELNRWARRVYIIRDKCTGAHFRVTDVFKTRSGAEAYRKELKRKVEGCDLYEGKRYYY